MTTVHAMSNSEYQSSSSEMSTQMLSETASHAAYAHAAGVGLRNRKMIRSARTGGTRRVTVNLPCSSSNLFRIRHRSCLTHQRSCLAPTFHCSRPSCRCPCYCCCCYCCFPSRGPAGRSRAAVADHVVGVALETIVAVVVDHREKTYFHVENSCHLRRKKKGVVSPSVHRGQL